MTFDDGQVTIYNVTNKSQSGQVPVAQLSKIVTLFYSRQSLGITRYYTALAADQIIEKVIAVPVEEEININQIAITDDNKAYVIRMIQLEKDEFENLIYKLSLERNGGEYEIITEQS